MNILNLTQPNQVANLTPQTVVLDKKSRCERYKLGKALLAQTSLFLVREVFAIKWSMQACNPFVQVSSDFGALWRRLSMKVMEICAVFDIGLSKKIATKTFNAWLSCRGRGGSELLSWLRSWGVKAGETEYRIANLWSERNNKAAREKKQLSALNDTTRLINWSWTW